MKILKNSNRTLLEVYTGVLAAALLAELIGAILPLEKWGLAHRDWYQAIGVAAVLDLLAFAHMYRCLDRALDYGEGDAAKLLTRGYLLRYALLAVVMIGAAVTQWLHPLILCLGYLFMMKAAAYMQPTTHRIYNRLFHESDPVPQPLAEDVQNNR